MLLLTIGKPPRFVEIRNSTRLILINNGLYILLKRHFPLSSHSVRSNALIDVGLSRRLIIVIGDELELEFIMGTLDLEGT
jgi:hypothetical protein